jgi:hypothetical protein
MDTVRTQIVDLRCIEGFPKITTRRNSRIYRTLSDEASIPFDQHGIRWTLPHHELLASEQAKQPDTINQPNKNSTYLKEYTIDRKQPKNLGKIVPKIVQPKKEKYSQHRPLPRAASFQRRSRRNAVP